jgi:hypothetical protein
MKFKYTNIILTTVLFLTVFGAMPSSIYAAENNKYYVDGTNGNDSNNGTSASPWKTISKAASAVTEGATVYVCAGTYNEHVTMVNSGSEGSPITFMPEEEAEVIIDGTGQGGDYCTGIISFYDKSYINIFGFTFIHGYGCGISVFDNTVKNSHNGIHLACEAGGTLDAINIKNNVVCNCRGMLLGIGYYLGGKINNVSIINNTFYRGKQAESGGGIAINMAKAWGGTCEVTNIIFRNNIVAADLPGEISAQVGEESGGNPVTASNNCFYNVDGSQFKSINNTNQNPFFANPGDEDFRLLAESPLIGKATSDGSPAQDIRGVDRPQSGGYDIGAYQYINPDPGLYPVFFTEVYSTNERIFPNPVTEGFYVNGLTQPAQLIVVDISGRQILSKQILNDEYINICFLPKELYILQLIIGEKVEQYKIIKK